MTLGWIWLFAVLARATLIFTTPVFENDYYRYLWDGRVVAHGVNPYQYSPLDPALDDLDVPYRESIGWSQFKTIYPPVSILTFGAIHLIKPDSLSALRIGLCLFDLAIGFVILLWLAKRGQPVIYVALYLLNPLG